MFVTYTGETKVVDFGIAKVADAAGQTRSGIIKGKLSYMAPEQAAGRALDRRVDSFAAGLMIWEIIAGGRIWKGSGYRIFGRLLAGASFDCATNVPMFLRLWRRLCSAPSPRIPKTATALRPTCRMT